MTLKNQDPDNVLVTLSQQRVTLELSSLDLCFAAALYLRAEGARLASFDEERLGDVFEQVCELLEPGAENVRARATHAIRRLRDQRLLARVDGAGVVRAGEFALSRLGASIVEFYLEEDCLTRESLTLLTGALRSNLTQVLAAANQASTPREWTEQVLAPLRVTVADLTAGIERRQRGLDHQQEEFQRQIGGLLEADWFGAIGECQRLLDSTATTLRELNSILLREGPELGSQLQDVLELAVVAGEAEVEAAVSRVVDQIDRIMAWGAARQQAWSEYYEYVHRYLRDVVRLDPTRALTQRLREQLSGAHGCRFSLIVADADPMRVLRDAKPTGPGPAVRRPRADTDVELATEVSEDSFALIEAKVREALQQGSTDLAALTAALTRTVPENERFLLAGRVAQIAAKLTRPICSTNRPWIVIDDQLCIEQWRLTSGETR